MITIDEAKKLTYRQEIYHVSFKNADDTKQRWRVNGKIKLWKKEPERFSIPIKHGLYSYGYLTNENNDRFTLEDD